MRPCRGDGFQARDHRSTDVLPHRTAHDHHELAVIDVKVQVVYRLETLEYTLETPSRLIDAMFFSSAHRWRAVNSDLK